MSIVLWILAVDLAALAGVWLMYSWAPFGYEDRTGFHHGIPPESKSGEADRPDAPGRREDSMFDRFTSQLVIRPLG